MKTSQRGWGDTAVKRLDQTHLYMHTQRLAVLKETVQWS